MKLTKARALGDIPSIILTKFTFYISYCFSIKQQREVIMTQRRITYDNELEIMIEDYLANPLEAELDRVIEGLAEEEMAERKAKVQSVLEGREIFEIPSAQILHNIMEVWRAFRPSVYKKLKRMEIMPLEAERLLQEQGRIKSKLPYNRETTDMFTLIGKDQDPLNEYPE